MVPGEFISIFFFSLFPSSGLERFVGGMVRVDYIVEPVHSGGCWSVHFTNEQKESHESFILIMSNPIE